MIYQIGDIVRVKKDHTCDATDQGYETAHDFFGDGEIEDIRYGHEIYIKWSKTSNTGGYWASRNLRLVKRPLRTF